MMLAGRAVKEIRISAFVQRGPSGKFGPPGSVEDLGVVSRSTGKEIDEMQKRGSSFMRRFLNGFAGN